MEHHPLNPFGALIDIAEYIVDSINENERIADEINKKKEQERLEKKRKKEEAEYKLWQEITMEALENPLEFRVLPDGWSPFGFRL